MWAFKEAKDSRIQIVSNLQVGQFVITFCTYGSKWTCIYVLSEQNASHVAFFQSVTLLHFFIAIGSETISFSFFHSKKMLRYLFIVALFFLCLSKQYTTINLKKKLPSFFNLWSISILVGLWRRSFYVIYQQRVRGFHQGFQTPRNTEIVSRCLEPLMKPEARVFDIASQSIFCCIVGIYYCTVFFTKLVCKLFIVGLFVTFFEVIFTCACERWMQVQLTPVLEFQKQSKKRLL